VFPQPLAPIWGSLALSALFAAAPLLLLFVLLGVFKVKAYLAALSGLAASVLLAIVGWGMPVGQALSGTAEGAFYGLFPILWILVNAMWVYKLSVISGWFEVLGAKIRAISDDQRVLAILIAFCFGALLESLAGFGAPVAISAAMLIAAGMKPLKSAVVSLLANTAPVAFGAMGAPIITLSAVTGLDLHTLASMAGRQTPFVALLVPLVLVFLVDGKRGLRQTWPIALVAGATFGLAQFVTSNFITVEITDIVAAIATVVVVLLMLRVWKPANPLALSEDETGDAEVAPGSVYAGSAAVSVGSIGTMSSGTISTGVGSIGVADGGGATIQTLPAPADEPHSSARLTWGAIAPYLIIIVVFSISQLPVVKAWLTAHGSFVFDWPGLDITNTAGKPVAATHFKLDHIKATGTLLLLSGVITALVYKIKPRQALLAYRDTLVQLKFTIITVTSVLALSFVMNLSGQTASLGTALASAGAFFVLLSPVLGWLGVAITGSDTSSNSLFGLLQVTAATQAGLDPVLMATTNSSAGVLGKMLSPQNLAVAAAAVGMAGKEGEIFRKLIGWSIALLALFTVLVVLQSTVLSWMVP
jgi:lactate permease